MLTGLHPGLTTRLKISIVHQFHNNEIISLLTHELAHIVLCTQARIT